MGFGDAFRAGRDIVGGVGQVLGAKNQRRREQEAAWAQEERLNEYFTKLHGQDRDPTYASDLQPQGYQKTSSPVARAYLESLMTGDNVQAAQSPWANPDDVAAVQKRNEQRYGNEGERIAQGAAERGVNPYQGKGAREFLDQKMEREKWESEQSNAKHSETNRWIDEQNAKGKR